MTRIVKRPTPRQGAPRIELPSRQIHLDFHNSPHLRGIASHFDPDCFAETMQRCQVESVTVFAKCHHGMCYYPTRHGTPHPGLEPGRDLLGEMITALHRRGIRAPIYTTVVWEEDVAQRFPQWRQLRQDGSFAEVTTGPDAQPGHIAPWRYNNFLDPDYQDYIETHLREIIERYGREVDGFFVDILFFAPGACWSPASRQFRQRQGLLGQDRATFERFQGCAQGAFAQRFTRLIQGLRPGASIFYNAPNDGGMDPQAGPRARERWQTHFELESLPSGFWGYHHFPRMARAIAARSQPWLGMTGRFQRMWGDFGGIKPVPALEFECFRSQALGGGNSVGDQLLPDGRLDPDAYALIGKVFAQCAEAEPFYAGSEPVQPRMGVFHASYPGLDGALSDEGAILLADELHRDAAMLDGNDDLAGFNLLMLPDTTVVSEALADRLEKFYQGGGTLILSHRSGFDEAGNWRLHFLPFENQGPSDRFPTYWRPRRRAPGSGGDRVIYLAGSQLVPRQRSSVLVDRVLPFFQRSALTYSSHFHAPPGPTPDRHPAILIGPRYAAFADPIFHEYRRFGSAFVRDMLGGVLDQLVGSAPFGAGLPPSILAVPRRRGRDLLLTLLRYLPVRKSLEIDVIDEALTFAGEHLRLTGHPEGVQTHRGEPLTCAPDGSWILPDVKGRLLLRCPNYFPPAPKPNSSRRLRNEATAAV